MYQALIENKEYFTIRVKVFLTNNIDEQKKAHDKLHVNNAFSCLGKDIYLLLYIDPTRHKNLKKLTFNIKK